MATSFANPHYIKRDDVTPQTCPAAMLSATSECDIKGQMAFYQDNGGSIWLTGTYQYGFQNPKEWDYCYTIQNKCGKVLFNLTDWLGMEYAKESGCNGYDDDMSKRFTRRRNILDKRNDDKCEIGHWGSKPWVIKVDDLTWDCGKKGFKYENCDGKDIYADMVVDYDKVKLPKRLSDQGPASGFYLVIEGSSKWGKRTTSLSPAAINVNNQATPAAAAAATPAAPAAPAAPPAVKG
ncbi:13184_t:CDS:2 [Dentiscutata erythropus]|uniref:13184_t:CDS:1 n=1 Tax=Dentiscutata erythropus TaxID=1348616 RepID=A0A9N8W1V0_9GLOM|nr:13184_t:CDS:2 [Dentiscutata erythropus]